MKGGKILKTDQLNIWTTPHGLYCSTSSETVILKSSVGLRRQGDYSAHGFPAW